MCLHRCQTLVNGESVQVALIVPLVLLLELDVQTHFKTINLKILPMIVRLTKLIESPREVKAAWIEVGGCKAREQSIDY